MILKNQVEWALHCCAILSILPDGEYLPAKSLAEFHGIPKEYLAKALQNLSQQGIVMGTLGPAGGYRLAKPAAEITFLDIVEAIEGKRSTFSCMEIRANNPCYEKKPHYSAPCTIARIMYEADEAWREKLRQVTLVELGTMLDKELVPGLLDKSRLWLLSRG